MLRTRTALLLVAVLAAVLSATMPELSSASFTSSTTSSATVGAAADWTPPTVTTTSPGSPVSGTVSVQATAADSGSGLASVELQYLAPNAAGWATLCTATSSTGPSGTTYSCNWNTRAGADGTYSLRAVATDRAGYATTSDPVSTTVANNLLVSLADPGDFVRGTVGLQAALYNTAGATYRVSVEYAPTGTTTWKSLCSNLAAPFACSWDTTKIANGSYDLRAAATANGTTTYSAVVVDSMVDNQAPAVTMTDPGSPLSGTQTFAATASDTDSGVAQVVLQYAVSGTTTWTTICTLTDAPYSCRFATTQLADGRYDVRAVATDTAGNTTTSAIVAGRTVDNTVASVSMEDPGAYLTGTVTLRASASTSAGVASVRIQRAPSGTSTWTDVCTLATGTSPYSCAWDTTTATDGLYDFRAILTDGTGRTTTSATVAARRVDNTPLRGYDVQATNGGATAGLLEAGDTLTFTYTDTVLPGSVTTGWDGSALAVQVRVRDGGVVGLSAKNDTLDVLRGGAAVNLGSVALEEDYVKGSKTVTFNATMTAASVPAGATSRTVVTLRLGAVASGTGLRAAGAAQAMVWTPSSAVTDAFGRTCSAAPVTELGTLDLEF